MGIMTTNPKIGINPGLNEIWGAGVDYITVFENQSMQKFMLQAVQSCWSLHDDQTKQRELDGVLDAMTVCQLNKG
jgi:hypothetical protein